MKTSRILRLVEEHEALREGGLNLVVSENVLSPAVRRALSSDLAGRYYAEWYGGAGKAREVVARTEELARTVFRARHALLSSLSGNLCDLAVLLAFTPPGGKMALLSFEHGGYPFGVRKFGREAVYLPVKPGSLEIDVEAAGRRIVEEGVPLTLLGASLIPFPHPVREIRSRVDRVGEGARLVYDGSHVLGLIACGVFQDPLREGAHVLIGSTHKTFFGPQGGLLLTDSDECAAALRRLLDFDLKEGLGLVDNPHVNRIAALGVALEEILEDPGYGARVIANARALARALHERAVPVRFREQGYTASHQVVLDLSPAEAERLCRRLEEAGIFVDIGGRIGTAEVTRRGLGPGDMAGVAELVAAVYHGGEPAAIRPKVRKLVNAAGGAG